jgi:hypothetical protein
MCDVILRFSTTAAKTKAQVMPEKPRQIRSLGHSSYARQADSYKEKAARDLPERLSCLTATKRGNAFINAFMRL